MTPMLKPGEAATLLGVSKSTLRNWRNAKHGPKWFGIGHAIRYPKADLMEWIARREFKHP